MSKRLFEILDQMNLDDTNSNTGNLGVSNHFVGANKVKQGCTVTMGADEAVLHQLMNNTAIPILVVVDKKEYQKLKNQ